MKGHPDRSGRKPWIRLSLSVLLWLLWPVSLWFSVLYGIPLTAYGPIGDGSSDGYDKVCCFGLAYGSVVVQTQCRSLTSGWQVEPAEDVAFCFWPFAYGWWPNRTFGLPIPLLILAVCVTTIPWCWRSLRLRSAG